MFANRLRKNLKHLGRWLKRENIHCYRLYDADMPEYALAIDVYEGEKRWVHVQEYEAPKSIDPQKAQARLHEALDVIIDLLEIPREQLFLKVRRQQKGSAQYEKLSSSREFHEVHEGGCRLLVNFSDYLDTGLFLDHRTTRGMLAGLAAGKRFLNLFAYTGSATVHAAMGGAVATTTVDMSRTYLDWAQRNMKRNGFNGEKHEFIQANCLEWMDKAAGKQRYDLIFLDPPSFSSSKRMDNTFDVQRDHVSLLRKTVKLLAPNGTLIFSNNLRSFKLDREELKELQIEDISRATLPKDFERNPKIHNCWKITKLSSNIYGKSSPKSSEPQE
jgi:23S rRNA (guanine2445-N2)-methyltransferase / 23S rRNA (guanine2069-N7)-methyltransferase